jgi:dimethylamine/trimethylamine dehydrogenase
MSATARRFDSFDEGFALSFNEEISGESYFAALAEAEADPRAAALLTKLSLIEAKTLAAMRPMAVARGLLPPDEDAIRQSGRMSARDRKHGTFDAFAAHVVRDYPAYVEEFTQLEALAPPEAKPLARLLTDHEVVMIDMARLVLAGQGDPHAPLDGYLSRIAAYDPS